MATDAESMSVSARPNLQSMLASRAKQEVETPAADTCITCHKKLPKINENLLKDSLRMKSEIAQLSTQRKSLMNMLAMNDDFAYSITPYSKTPLSNTPHTRAATSDLIDEQRYQSVMNKYTEVMRNRGLHDCEKLHTHSRKHEYKKWDYSHSALAKYGQQKKENVGNIGWLTEHVEGDNFTEESSECDIGDLADEEHPVPGDMSSSRVTARTGRTTLTRRTRPPSQDDEKDIPDTDRVQMTVERIRKAKKGGMLSEIQLIKDRHKQLAALIGTKTRTGQDSPKLKRTTQMSESKREEHLLKKFLLANANLQKEIDFNNFKERTKPETKRNFTEKATKVLDPGVVWAPKWTINKTNVPGRIRKSTHPVSDARKGTKATYKPAKLGDLPPCVYLPKHIDAKIPVESAWLLDRFMKETLQTASSGEPVGVLPLPADIV